MSDEPCLLSGQDEDERTEFYSLNPYSNGMLT